MNEQKSPGMYITQSKPKQTFVYAELNKNIQLIRPWPHLWMRVEEQ